MRSSTEANSGNQSIPVHGVFAPKAVEAPRRWMTERRERSLSNRARPALDSENGFVSLGRPNLGREAHGTVRTAYLASNLLTLYRIVVNIDEERAVPLESWRTLAGCIRACLMFPGLVGIIVYPGLLLSLTSSSSRNSTRFLFPGPPLDYPRVGVNVDDSLRFL